MTLHNQVEAAIRRAGGDFSQASPVVCRLLDDEYGADMRGCVAEDDEPAPSDWLDRR